MMRWLQEGYLKTLLEKLGCWLFRSLTRDQKALQERIASAVKTSCDREIVFTSEWLGYLPFGCYCWLEYTNEEGVIQDIDMPFGCGERDLAALERHGFLQKTGERRNPDDSFDYSLSYRVGPERTRHDPENSERSSRRRRSEFT